MPNLVERYVHQVGRYLPPKERIEIEAELRSQIQDQLDDRYGESPSEAEVATVLAEFGHPYQMATSYSGEQYLVGPLLYPFMMMVLHQGWLIVPAIVVFVNIFGVLISSEAVSVVNLLIETVIGILEATLIFTAVVVLFFAFLQHTYLQHSEKDTTFNALELTEVDDPRSVDRIEAAFGIAVGTIVALALIYFLRVGGLTLRFNLSDPGEILPVPSLWLLLFILDAFAMVILHVIVLRRNRWSVGLWLTQTLLEMLGVVCLYFVLYEPIVGRILTSFPALANLPGSNRAPEILAVISAIINMASNGHTLIKLWNYSNSGPPPFAVQTEG